MDYPTISIVVPVYNVEAYLEKCVESLVNQTVAPSEIILVDDGSKDRSGILCDELSSKYSNVKVIHQKNGGLSVARNTGIRAATGDYLMFVDSDDTIVLDACEQFQTAINKRDVEIAIGNFYVIKPTGTSVKKHYMTDSSTMVSGDFFLKIEIDKKTMFAPVQQGLYSRKFLLKNQLSFEPGILHEDQVFMPTVLHTAKNVLPTDIVFYNHTIRENSITTQKDKTPNALSIIKICGILEKLAQSITDDKLKKQILDHAVDLYYKVYIDAKLKEYPDIRLKRDYLRRNSFSLKNHFRTTLYCISESLFALLEENRRTIKSHI